MPRSLLWGIRSRVALVSIVTTAVVVVVAGALGLRVIEGELRESVDRELIDRAERAAPTLAAVASQPELVEVLAGSAIIPSGVRVVTGAEEPLVLGRFPRRAPIPDDDQIADVSADGAGWRVLTIRFDPIGPQAETVVQFAESLAPTDRELATIRRRIAVVGLVALVVAGVVGWLAGSVSTAPLRRLARQAAAGGGRYTEHQGVREVDELARALNEAADRVRAEMSTSDAALAAARGFTADASHELGTPLTAMGADLDVLAAHPDLPVEEREEIVAELRLAHGRMLDLLAMLRALARGEQQGPRSFEPVELADVVDDAVDEIRRRNPYVRVQAVVPRSVVVAGWEPGLRLVVENLLRNAVVHGRRAGAIGVVLRTTGESVELVVDDDGAGFGDGDPRRLLGRFARGSADQPGSGLGLALVDQQVSLHGGSIDLGESPAGGARVFVTLPSAHQGADPGLDAAVPRDGRGVAEQQHDDASDGVE